MFRETPNKLQVIAPSFGCDTSLGDVPPPCPSGHFFWGIFGSAGRGKTSHLLSLLTAKAPNKVYRKVFHNVFFIIPPNSRNSIKGDIFEKHDPAKVFDELNAPTLQHIKDTCMAEAMEGYNSVLILDDVTASLKDKSVDKLLRELAYNRRHFFLSIFILGQSYSQMPLSIRKTLSHISCFAPANKKEISSIFEELIFLDKKTAEALIRYVFKEKHDFLFGDTQKGTFCRNFNEIHINHPEEHNVL